MFLCRMVYVIAYDFLSIFLETILFNTAHTAQAGRVMEKPNYKPLPQPKANRKTTSPCQKPSRYTLEIQQEALILL